MSQRIEGPNRTFTAGAALAKFIRVTLTAGKLAAADGSTSEIGVIDEAAFADGDIRSVRLRTAEGTDKFVASEAITAGNPVYAAASGKIAASGTVLVGKALEAATANGDIIEVVRAGESSAVAAAGGTTAAAFEVDSDSSTPKLKIAGQAGGTGDYTTTLVPEATLSADNTVIVPEADGDTLTAVALAQTLTNKTLTAPVINLPSVKIVTEKHTAGDTLLAAETGSHHSNTGASGTITLVLPAAVVGLEFSFYVGAAQELRLDPAGSETIALPSTGVQGAAGKYLVADAVGEHVRLVCETAGTWLAFPYAGTWTAEG